MNYFCTYCDRGYVARLLCLHKSLLDHGEPFRLEVLCFDADVAAVIAREGQSSLVGISLQELLDSEADYAAVRQQRSRLDFYFTTTPVLISYCLKRDSAIDRITYLDADLYFFGSPSAVFAEQKHGSIGIVPHRFPPRLEERLRYGTYNVSWVSFVRDEPGRACLAWWRERCLEWCHDVVDGTRFGDQGYLDEFPRRFSRVKVLHHPGINAAPWNMAEVAITNQSGRLLVDDQPLLFFHFQGVRELKPGWFEPGLRAYGTPCTRELRNHVYLPYLKQLTAFQQRLFSEQGIVPALVHPRLNASTGWMDRWERIKGRWLLPYYGWLRGQVIRCSASKEIRS